MNANYWHYRRNANACWRLRDTAPPDGSLLGCQRCVGRWGLCDCRPNPWRPLPELEPDGKEPQLLLADVVEPPGLGPGLEDVAVWRHLLRGTHGFSLQGPEPVARPLFSARHQRR